MPSAGKLLLTFVALVTSIGCYIADFNHTHIYNPNWTPHAKFHGGQTMSMGLTLGLLTLFILYRPSGTNSKSEPQVEKERLQYAALVASLYWVTQASAILYPGTKFVDPEFGESGPQIYLDAGLLSLVMVGYWLGSRELDRERVKGA